MWWITLLDKRIFQEISCLWRLCYAVIFVLWLWYRVISSDAGYFCWVILLIVVTNIIADSFLVDHMLFIRIRICLIMLFQFLKAWLCTRAITICFGWWRISTTLNSKGKMHHIEDQHIATASVSQMPLWYNLLVSELSLQSPRLSVFPLVTWISRITIMWCIYLDYHHQYSQA